MSFREHVILGRTGLHVSRLGIASGYGVPDHAVERAFHEHGINYFYWGAPRFRELLQRPSSPIDVFMVRYNAAHRGAETEIFPHLPAENRPGVTTYTATRWGQLLKPAKMPPADRERPLTAAECYRFVLTSPHVDLCMTGPSSAAHLEEALKALDAGPLSDEELARARRIGDHVHG